MTYNLRIGMFLFFSFCLSAVVSAHTHAQAATSHSRQALEDLIQLLQPLSALRGTFTQRQSTLDGEELSTSEGEFVMQRPNQMRWETREPFAQLLVSDGEFLWLYDPDLEQVTVNAVGEQMQQTPAVLFAGDPALIEENYTVSRNDTQSFVLFARSPGAQIRKLELSFEEGLPSRLSVEDGFAQNTEFHFNDVEPVTQVPAETFQFEPPAGTDVLRND